MARIGVLTFSVDPRNGLGRFTREVIVRMAALGHQLCVLTYHKDEVDAELLAVRGLEIRKILPSHYDLAGLITVMRWARRVAREFAGVETIHAFFDFPHTELAARAARRLDIPFTASAVGTYSIAPLHNRRTAGRMAVALLEAHQVIAISRYTLREIEKVIKLPNAQVVPLGIDAREFATGAPPEARPPTDRFVVLGVGALKSRKGWDLVIDAVARLAHLDPPVHLVVAGGLAIGDAASRLQKQAEAAGIGDRFHLPGLVGERDLRALYASAHLFCLPARSDRFHVEGFGLVYLEAGAYGLPQIGCLDTGAEEPIVDGHSGILVPQSDPAAIAAAIERLHRDPDERARLSRGARARAEELTWDATTAGMLAAFPSGVLTRRRPSTHRVLRTERF